MCDIIGFFVVGFSVVSVREIPTSVSFRHRFVKLFDIGSVFRHFDPLAIDSVKTAELSPFLFRFYICDLVNEVILLSASIGCKFM